MKKLLLILTGLFLMVGCSSQSASTSDETRLYNGIEIPAHPQRVVADYFVGELVKLEANLVGADMTYTSSAWADKVQDVVNIGQSFEMVASLNPDLIITMNEELVSQYQAIAPTVLIPYGTYNPEDLVIELSKITDTEQVANEWIAQFNQNVNELKEVMPEGTYTIIDDLGADQYYYGEHYGRAGYIIYNKLGLKGTEQGEATYIRPADSYLLANVEGMTQFVGDYLLMVNTTGTNESNKLTDSVVFENLDTTVKYFKSEDMWYNDPFSLDLQVQLLKEAFGK